MKKVPNLNNKRGFLEIMSTMLGVLEEQSSKKTSLASRANLSTRASNRYVDSLVRFNFAVESNEYGLCITEKGRAFSNEYRKLEQLVHSN